MTERPLYVRLPEGEADLIDRAAAQDGVSKRQVVSRLVREGLAPGRDLPVGRLELRPADTEVLTLEQAAALLQTTDEVVAEMARSGELPGREVGGAWRFARNAILSWLGHMSSGLDSGVTPPSTPSARRS